MRRLDFGTRLNGESLMFSDLRVFLSNSRDLSRTSLRKNIEPALATG